MTLEKIDIDETLKSLYKKWPDIKRFLKSRGCGSADADDILSGGIRIMGDP